jgi:dethiobiotin synthetase
MPTTPPISPLTIPGLFITGTDTGVGKTLVTGAIAALLVHHHRVVAVAKPITTGCVHRREGLVSEDAEWLAHCARTRHPLDLVCPQRYAEPLAPAVAADRAGVPVDYAAIDRALRIMSEGADVMLVEGIGGIMVPIDPRHTVLDLVRWLNIPAIVVARAGLGTINHTLLTIGALRQQGIPVAGVVINRYPTDTPPPAEETNPRAIERWGKTKVLCLVPECPMLAQTLPAVPASVTGAVGQVDWMGLLTAPLP